MQAVVLARFDDERQARQPRPYSGEVTVAILSPRQVYRPLRRTIRHVSRCLVTAGPANVAVANLAYAHPGGDLLFDCVSFRVAPGRHAGLIGTNGVGKSTLLRILAGELQAAEGQRGPRRPGGLHAAGRGDG